MEQVIKDGETTYCKVASQLINDLKQNNITLTQSDDYYPEEGDDDIDDKGSNAFVDKGEKNIKRRVYDALNVQFAAGVLIKKANKYISPNYNCKEFQRIYANLLQTTNDLPSFKTLLKTNEDPKQKIKEYKKKIEMKKEEIRRMK